MHVIERVLTISRSFRLNVHRYIFKIEQFDKEWPIHTHSIDNYIVPSDEHQIPEIDDAAQWTQSSKRKTIHTKMHKHAYAHAEANGKQYEFWTKYKCKNSLKSKRSAVLHTLCVND